MVDPDLGHIPAPPRRRRVLPVLAAVLAVVALVLAFLPVGSFLAGLPALAAIVLAVVLLVVGARRLLPALTVLVAVVAVVVAVVVSVGQVGTALSRFAARLPDADDPPTLGAPPSAGVPTAGTPSSGAQGSAPPLDAGDHEIVYEVLGDGDARVAYTAFVGGRFGTSTERAVQAPHARTQRVTVQEDGGEARFSMIVSRDADETAPLGCRIRIDGRTVSERPAASGSAAALLCSVEAD